MDSYLDSGNYYSEKVHRANSHIFVFDHVYDQNSSQKRIFETTANPVVESALQGYNATIFACKIYCFWVVHIFFK